MTAPMIRLATALRDMDYRTMCRLSKVLADVIADQVSQGEPVNVEFIAWLLLETTDQILEKKEPTS